MQCVLCGAQDNTKRGANSLNNPLNMDVFFFFRNQEQARMFKKGTILNLPFYLRFVHQNTPNNSCQIPESSASAIVFISWFFIGRVDGSACIGKTGKCGNIQIMVQTIIEFLDVYSFISKKSMCIKYSHGVSVSVRLKVIFVKII